MPLRPKNDMQFLRDLAHTVDIGDPIDPAAVPRLREIANALETNIRLAERRWWKYAVVRGDGVPAELDGLWFDLDELPPHFVGTGPAATLEATNRWEQREDGAVAVVYEWTRR